MIFNLSLKIMIDRSDSILITLAVNTYGYKLQKSKISLSVP